MTKSVPELDSIMIGKQIGEGNFGEIYSASWNGSK
jgi:hypothetical protein